MVTVASADGSIESVVEAFRNGGPVLIFDSAFREQETDLLFPGTAATPAAIRRLRIDCGGLLFLAIGDEVGAGFGLPWLQDIHTDAGLVAKHPVLGKLITDDLQYDSRSAFTLTLNHRDTFTGITDRDRSLTTRRFADLWSELTAAASVAPGDSGIDSPTAIEALGAEFRTPGHIPVCRETPGGLANRQGHTELAVAIARLAGMAPVVIGAEMLQPDGDAALPLEDAQAYGEAHGIPFASGADILAASGLD